MESTESESPRDIGKKQNLSILQLMLLTASIGGISFSWAVQCTLFFGTSGIFFVSDTYTTPVLLSLGMPVRIVSFAWLAGPISGIVVQPLIGAWSDRCRAKLGRRRPFMIVGAILVAIALVLFSNAHNLGMWMGDSETSHPRGLTLALIGFWVLDFSINAVQGPCRTLLVDVAPPGQQAHGNSAFMVWTGLGNFFGYMFGSANIVRALAFLISFSSNALYSLGGVMMLLCVGLTSLFVKETPLEEEEEEEENMEEDPLLERTDVARERVSKSGVLQVLRELWHALFHMPVIVQRVCLLQLPIWFAWFTYFLFMSDWVGKNVFGGDPQAPLSSPARNMYEDGVRFASRGLAYQAIVALVVAPLYPFLMRTLGVKLVYAQAQIMQGVSLLLTLLVKTKVGAMVIIAVIGVPWAATYVIPYTIVGKALEQSPQKGVFMATYNLFLCFPEIAVSFCIPPILASAHDNVAVALAVGGAFGLLGAAGTRWLILPSN